MRNQILDKKVKKNPKYEGVKSVVATGKTMKDVEIMSKSSLDFRKMTVYDQFCFLRSNVLGDQMVAKRKNEKFKRIKCSTLAKLLQENNNDESVYQLADMSEQVSFLSSQKLSIRCHRCLPPKEVEWVIKTTQGL